MISLWQIPGKIMYLAARALEIFVDFIGLGTCIVGLIVFGFAVAILGPIVVEALHNKPL